MIKDVSSSRESFTRSLRRLFIRRGDLLAMMIFILSLSVYCPYTAFAHAFPELANPRVGATVRELPKEVSIVFDSQIEPMFSNIRVENETKVRVDKNDSHIDPQNPKKLIVSLVTPLSPGKYRVDWTAVAHDGHRTTGDFRFWIKPFKKTHG